MIKRVRLDASPACCVRPIGEDYRRRRRISGKSPMMPVAVSASVPGSGTVLDSGTKDGASLCGGGPLSVVGTNGLSFVGAFGPSFGGGESAPTTGGCVSSGGLVDDVVSVGGLFGGGLVCGGSFGGGLVCGGLFGEDVGVDAPIVGPDGVVEKVWKSVVPGDATEPCPEWVKARKSPAPTAAPLPASQAARLP